MNTFKTVLGYFQAMFAKLLPFEKGGDSLDGIYNYLEIDENLATSGQPTAKQFALIGDAGYQSVINLAPSHFIENSLKDERAVLGELGVRYVHIPVDFKNPTRGDFDKFVNAMQSAQGEKVWVHCAANARVSAFVFRYRRDVLGEDEPLAKRNLERIWKPLGVWKRFVGER